MPEATDQVWCFGRESVEAAIAAIGRGEVVCVVDDEDRENEGDFILAAEKATKESVAFMIKSVPALKRRWPLQPTPARRPFSMRVWRQKAHAEQF
jgi:hypothetical protein